MPASKNSLRGATLVESVVVLPLLLFMVLATMQAAMVFYAKSNLNYAAFEAARAGSVNHASIDSIQAALLKALLPYYGGGLTEAELLASAGRAAADFALGAARVEILSPTVESFSDYNSPFLQHKLQTSQQVVPDVGLDELRCPREAPSCRSDPASNASGQTLQDANLLKLKITYGIAPAKQMPIVGRFYTWVLNRMGAGAGDAFLQRLIDAGRIPVVVHAVIRMQSEAIRNSAMVGRGR